MLRIVAFDSELGVFPSFARAWHAGSSLAIPGSMRSLLLGFGLLAAWTSVSEQAHATGHHRVVATYGDRRELTCTTVHEGRLWFGSLGGGMLRVSAKGAMRFGANAGLPGERVRDCRSDGAALWVATDAGLARWDPQLERFAAVSGGRYLRLALGERLRLAADGLGRVYAIERDRVRAIARLEFAPTALAVSADGTRWAAGGPLGDLFVSEPAASPKLRTAGLNHPEPIEALHFRGAVLEVRTTDHTLEYASGQLRIVRAGTAEREIELAPSPLVAAAPRVQAETSWYGARVVATDRGAFVREPQSDHFRPFELGDGLPCGDRISALAVHRGALWVGSFDRGLCRRDATGWAQLHGPSVLPSDMINDLVSDGERLYVATARGLSVLEPDGRFRQYEHLSCRGDLQRDCPWSAPVNGVAFDVARREVWIADLRAVHRLDPTGWRHIGGEAIGSFALTRLAAHGGELAAGSSDQGVSLRRGKRFERIDDQSGLADNWVMDVTYDSAGRLWAATCTRGVSVREPDGALSTLAHEQGLVDDYTLSVSAIGDTVWVGTLSGVSVVRDHRVIQNLSTRDGLSGNEVHDAVELDGHVWLATDAGLSVLAAAQ